MAFIERSSKLDTGNGFDQMKVVSEGFVLFRLLKSDNSYVLMTATADEDDKSYRCYDDLEKLVAVASKVFGRGEHKIDKSGRPYFEIKNIMHPTTIRNLSNGVCQNLNLEPCEAMWADEEMHQLYEDFSLGDGEKAYLSDGVYIDQNGNLSDG